MIDTLVLCNLYCKLSYCNYHTNTVSVLRSLSRNIRIVSSCIKEKEMQLSFGPSQ